MPPEPKPTPDGGLVVRTPDQPVGSAARLAATLARVLRLPLIAVGHDGNPHSARCAELFANHAIHGGYAEGHTWQPVNAIALGEIDAAAFLTCLPGIDAAGARFSAGGEGTVTCHLHQPTGQPFDQEVVAEVLRRIADNLVPLPVNAHSVGSVTSRPDLASGPIR